MILISTRRFLNLKTVFPIIKSVKNVKNMKSAKKRNELRSYSSIHPTVVIDDTAKIGKNSTIDPFVYIGPGVHIGDDAKIGSHCSLINCTIGNRIILHSGVRIGQDGFGFIPVKDNAELPEKKPQELRVLIKDDVEIGANSAVDRGSWRDTEIGTGAKFDNFVHIAHNVIVGKNCLLAACTSVAGSYILGNNVLMGGQSGIIDHIKIGSGVKIGGQGGITKDVMENTTVVVASSIYIETLRKKKKINIFSEGIHRQNSGNSIKDIQNW